MSKILIVEDEVAIADLEKDYLELSGFEVVIENAGDTNLLPGDTVDINTYEELSYLLLHKC